MTKRTFSIETTATATVVVDFDAFQVSMAEARRLAAVGRRTELHPMTSAMIEAGYSDEAILEAAIRHATSAMVKDALKEDNSNKNTIYFKGIQVTTKCTPKKPL